MSHTYTHSWTSYSIMRKKIIILVSDGLTNDLFFYKGVDIKSKYLNEIKIAMENSVIIMKRGKYRANSFDYDHCTGSQV